MVRRLQHAMMIFYVLPATGSSNIHLRQEHWKPVTIALTENDWTGWHPMNTILLSAPMDRLRIFTSWCSPRPSIMAVWLIIRASASWCRPDKGGSGVPSCNGNDIQDQTHSHRGCSIVYFEAGPVCRGTQYQHQSIFHKKAICIGENIRNTDFSPNVLNKKITTPGISGFIQPMLPPRCRPHLQNARRAKAAIINPNYWSWNYWMKRQQ